MSSRTSARSGELLLYRIDRETGLAHCHRHVLGPVTIGGSSSRSTICQEVGVTEDRDFLRMDGLTIRRLGEA